MLAVVAGGLLLSALGLSDRSVIGIALIAVGLALAWRQGGSFRADAPLSSAGSRSPPPARWRCCRAVGRRSGLLAPGAVAGALLLIAGPWVWRLALDRDAERTARIRSDERAEVAARVHDSVLQTLALIQRHADEPRRVASLARRQERELRGWLYGDQPIGDDTRRSWPRSSAAAGDVEELHGVRVELASAGDCPVDDGRRRGRAGSARGDDERGQVRRGRRDRRLRGGHRRGGLASSCATAASGSTATPCRPTVAASSSRSRAGWSVPAARATIVTSPGDGTEVELHLLRGAS